MTAALLFPTTFGIFFTRVVAADSGETEPIYVGIAKYYDNRKCVVTFSLSGYVYYRYLETDPWVLMENKSSEDFFKGVDASRFNFTGHKAYVSVRFSDISHKIHLQLHNTTIPPPSPPVGGIWIPVDKPRLLAPWIALKPQQ